MTSKSTSNLLKDHRILMMILFKYWSCCDSIWTKTMQNWNFETTHFRHLWINMQWIVITI